MRQVGAESLLAPHSGHPAVVHGASTSTAQPTISLATAVDARPKPATTCVSSAPAGRTRDSNTREARMRRSLRWIRRASSLTTTSGAASRYSL